MVYTVTDVKAVMLSAARTARSAKELLTEIDSKLGDGDMGVSMEKAALALEAEIAVYEGEDIGKLLSVGAAAINRAAPSTMGTLISGALMAAARHYTGASTLQERDAAGIPRMFADAISARGRAKPGDKTVLDALIPYADALERQYADSGDLRRSLQAAAESARLGMEATKGIVARTGRARWLAERNREYPDGGAMLLALIAQAVAGKEEQPDEQ